MIQKSAKKHQKSPQKAGFFDVFGGH